MTLRLCVRSRLGRSESPVMTAAHSGTRLQRAKKTNEALSSHGSVHNTRTRCATNLYASVLCVLAVHSPLAVAAPRAPHSSRVAMASAAAHLGPVKRTRLRREQSDADSARLRQGLDGSSSDNVQRADVSKRRRIGEQVRAAMKSMATRYVLRATRINVEHATWAGHGRRPHWHEPLVCPPV